VTLTLATLLVLLRLAGLCFAYCVRE